MNNQHETIIPSHYRVARYKKGHHSFYLIFPLGTLGTALAGCFSLSDSNVKRLLSGAITGDEPAAGISVGDMSGISKQIW